MKAAEAQVAALRKLGMEQSDTIGELQAQVAALKADLDAARGDAEAWRHTYERDASEQTPDDRPVVTQLKAQVAALTQERDEWKREAELSKWPKDAAQEYHRLKAENPRLEAALATVLHCVYCATAFIPDTTPYPHDSCPGCRRGEAALANTRQALADADEATSRAHDIVWASYPEWEGEQGRREPLNAALWRLHEILRPALAAGDNTTPECRCEELVANARESLEVNVDEKYRTADAYLNADATARQGCPVHGAGDNTPEPG